MGASEVACVGGRVTGGGRGGGVAAHPRRRWLLSGAPQLSPMSALYFLFKVAACFGIINRASSPTVMLLKEKHRMRLEAPRLYFWWALKTSLITG